MTDDQPTPPTPSSDSPLPESDPRNPLDLILKDGPHDRKTLRLDEDTPARSRNVLLLSSNDDGRPSAPFFAEYRPTDRVDPYTGLRIWQYIGIGINAAAPILSAKKKGNHPHA